MFKYDKQSNFKLNLRVFENNIPKINCDIKS